MSTTPRQRRTLWSDIARLFDWALYHPVTSYLTAFGLGVAYARVLWGY